MSRRARFWACTSPMKAVGINAGINRDSAATPTSATKKARALRIREFMPDTLSRFSLAMHELEHDGWCLLPNPAPINNRKLTADCGMEISRLDASGRPAGALPEGLHKGLDNSTVVFLARSGHDHLLRLLG